METISKTCVSILADLMESYGVRRAVVSPGSRNAPVVVALNRKAGIECTVVVDERTAGFVALGMARRGEPVALVCTSGTAVLNYAPAVAEAYYSGTPLIVVSADRPAELIDQRDSQTIRQAGALSAIVKKTVEVSDLISPAFANRLINDALAAALEDRCGPVHINMPLGRPLTEMADSDDIPKGTGIVSIRAEKLDMENNVLRRLLAGLNDPDNRILVVVGSMPVLKVPCAVAGMPNVAVLSEINANVRGCECISPTLFDGLLPASEYRPDMVVSIGGPLISDSFKGFLRSCRVPVVNIGYDDAAVDTFLSPALTQIKASPEEFFRCWEKSVGSPTSATGGCGYSALWSDLAKKRLVQIQHYLHEAPWSDLVAVETIARMFPENGIVFISNGMSARYCQLVRWNDPEYVGANRGVSGIDGCTSTAAGISMTTGTPVLLVSGDMGAAYDSGAFALSGIGSNFKILVLDNGGGDIFRHVRTTAHLPECETYFAASPRMPFAELAEAYGFAYWEAESRETMRSACAGFMTEAEKPSLLRVRTSAENNRIVYDTIFTQNK